VNKGQRPETNPCNWVLRLSRFSILISSSEDCNDEKFVVKDGSMRRIGVRVSPRKLSIAILRAIKATVEDVNEGLDFRKIMTSANIVSELIEPTTSFN